VTCGVLKFAKQPYYRWLKDPVSAREWDEAHLINAALDVHADDPAFGYRFIADELAAQGFDASERRVWRVCSEAGIFSSFVRRRRGKTGLVGPPVRDDLVRREFTADGPNRLWLTDISEHPTSEGKVYLCAVKDVWSNRIVGYSIDARMTSELAVAAIRMESRTLDPRRRAALAHPIRHRRHRRHRHAPLGRTPAPPRHRPHLQTHPGHRPQRRQRRPRHHPRRRTHRRIRPQPRPRLPPENTTAQPTSAGSAVNDVLRHHTRSG